MDPTNTSNDLGHRRWIQRVDRLLRQVAGGADADDASEPTMRELLWIGVTCAALYGVTMGLYAASMRGWAGVAQLLMATVKVPMLFALTIVVTFPSSYVLCAVRGGASTWRQWLHLHLVGTALAAALLASLGPITVFFTLSTESHGFMVLMNTVFFAIAGALGMRMIWRRSERLLRSSDDAARSASTGLGLIRAWFVIAIAVFAQSAWILRPMIGRPEDGFVLFEPRSSNAFAGFLDALREMAS